MTLSEVTKVRWCFFQRTSLAYMLLIGFNIGSLSLFSSTFEIVVCHSSHKGTIRKIVGG